MKPKAREWVTKADEDYRSARRLLRARKDPTYNTVCFHAQQCAEKYMKAVLAQNQIGFSRTHDLSTLLDKLIPIEPMWELLRSAAKGITDYAVRFRYPGRSASKEMAKGAIWACDQICDPLRGHLGLPPVVRKRAGMKTRASKMRRNSRKQ